MYRSRGIIPISYKEDNIIIRRAHTGTHNSIGGPWREVFDICAGDDLELGSTKTDNGATLLGCLMIVMEQMPTMLSKEDKEVFKQKSMSTFAMLNYPKCEQQNTSDT